MTETLTDEQRALLEWMVFHRSLWLPCNEAEAIAAALATIAAQREEYDDMVRAFCRAAGVERDDHGQAIERVTKMRADLDAQREEIERLKAALNEERRFLLADEERRKLTGDALLAEGRVAALEAENAALREFVDLAEEFASTQRSRAYLVHTEARFDAALDALRKEKK